MEKELYTVDNQTEQVYIIYEVGRFEPGKTDIELTQEQVEIMADQATLTCTKKNTTPAATKPAAKAVPSEDAKAE